MSEHADIVEFFDPFAEEAPAPVTRAPARPKREPVKKLTPSEAHLAASGGMEAPPAAPPDRRPPHSAEAEEHVIACCLLDDGETVGRCLGMRLTPEAFYFPANRLLFEIMAELHEQKKSLTLETLAEELKTRRQLDAVGGWPYLVQVTGKVPTTVHAGFFIEKVREKHVLRDLIKTATSTVEQCYTFTGDLDQLLDDTKASLTRVIDHRPADDALTECEYDPKKELQKPETVFSIAGTPVCTPGNLTTLYSQAKAGKTAQLGGFIAAAMDVPGSANDTLSVTGANTKGKALIHFDTEQSHYDRQQMIKTACRRVHLDKPPAWFKSYILTGKSAKECRLLVERAIRLNHRKFGGTYAVILDGVGDLVDNPNDEEECFPLVTRLHGLAIEFETPIISILHLNPSSESKGRGHLGSQLERKSESNLMLEKNAEEITTLYALKQRGKMIPKKGGPAFTWSEEKGMHVTCEAPSKTEGPKGRSGRGLTGKFKVSEVIDLFPVGRENEKPFAQLAKKANDTLGMPKSTFADYRRQLKEDGQIEMGDLGGWYRPLAPGAKPAVKKLPVGGQELLDEVLQEEAGGAQ